ncbi:MAG: hypothetical protein N4A35_03430 [Flavobacteriales bacterium]|jgi:hypothetical protein|nr:hypothetical protein [Flavobacteriales bacterium]
MNKFKSLFVIITLALVTFSCAKKIPYSKEIENKYGITEKNLGQLQFYLVNDIILVSDESSNNNSTDLDEDGHIIVKEELNTDRILIKSGTRGIFEKKMDGNKISISFEAGDGRHLTFGASTVRGRYIIQASEWKPDGSGIVEYANRKYKLSRTSSGAYITVKLKKTKQLNNSSRIAKGRKV